MDVCDRCNRPICHGCPYQEPDKTPAERFAENLETGWDYAIETLSGTTTDCVILELIEVYWNAYKYQQNNDPDDGDCFEIRQYAVKEISKRLEV